MFKNESCSEFTIKKLNKYLCKTERLFLNRLYFWSSHRKNFGIEKDGRVWIYNTLDNWSDQIGVSKSSIRRAIKSLKEKGFVDSNYLAINRRNRTLYYSINFEKINDYLSKINVVPYIHIKDLNTQKNVSSEHMDEHLYIIDNSKQIINKSYKSNKSIKNKIQKNSDQTALEKSLLDLRESKNKASSVNVSDTDIKFKSTIVIEDNDIETPPQKPTIIQDMIRIWNEEFASSTIQLTKSLARFLVAAFKTKFNSCLKEWKRYLKTLKTSIYIMNEKFKLSIWWVIKFITIDRIRAGELGAKPESVVDDPNDLAEKAKHHICEVHESEKCKDFRKKIVTILNPSTYVSWFMKVDFVENNGKIVMKAHNSFVEDWVMRNFADRCGLSLV